MSKKMSFIVHCPEIILSHLWYHYDTSQILIQHRKDHQASGELYENIFHFKTHFFVITPQNLENYRLENYRKFSIFVNLQEKSPKKTFKRHSFLLFNCPDIVDDTEKD